MKSSRLLLAGLVALGGAALLFWAVSGSPDANPTRVPGPATNKQPDAVQTVSLPGSSRSANRLSSTPGGFTVVHDSQPLAFAQVLFVRKTPEHGSPYIRAKTDALGKVRRPAAQLRGWVAHAPGRSFNAAKLDQQTLSLDKTAELKVLIQNEPRSLRLTFALRLRLQYRQTLQPLQLAVDAFHQDLRGRAAFLSRNKMVLDHPLPLDGELVLTGKHRVQGSVTELLRVSFTAKQKQVVLDLSSLDKGVSDNQLDLDVELPEHNGLTYQVVLRTDELKRKRFVPKLLQHGKAEAGTRRVRVSFFDLDKGSYMPQLLFHSSYSRRSVTRGKICYPAIKIPNTKVCELALPTLAKLAVTYDFHDDEIRDHAPFGAEVKRLDSTSPLDSTEISVRDDEGNHFRWLPAGRYRLRTIAGPGRRWGSMPQIITLVAGGTTKLNLVLKKRYRLRIVPPKPPAANKRMTVRIQETSKRHDFIFDNGRTTTTKRWSPFVVELLEGTYEVLLDGGAYRKTVELTRDHQELVFPR